MHREIGVAPSGAKSLVRSSADSLSGFAVNVYYHLNSGEALEARLLTSAAMILCGAIINLRETH
jgi:hypothetical protein